MFVDGGCRWPVLRLHCCTVCAKSLVLKLDVKRDSNLVEVAGQVCRLRAHRLHELCRLFAACDLCSRKS